jgi:protoporphyrin/coproporphyrin ferrochelatase
MPTLNMANENAILLLAHGSPDSVADVPEFLLRVTGGRPLPAEAVEEVRHRYGLIGGSPLTALTLQQAKLLSARSNLPVYVGMRNWNPSIPDALAQMTRDGIRRAVVICLAPQSSQTSVGLYRSALMANPVPFSVDFVESWHDHPLLIQAFAEKLLGGLKMAISKMAAQNTAANMPVIFTAHSVPQRGDSNVYERQARETASLVVAAAGLDSGTRTFAFQSQGMSGGPWLGPTVEDTILELKRKGHTAVFIQPIGFLCDHVEVLYDIDISFRQFAEKQDMQLWRTASLNDSPLLISALAEIALSRLG